MKVYVVLHYTKEVEIVIPDGLTESEARKSAIASAEQMANTVVDFDWLSSDYMKLDKDNNTTEWFDI